MPGAFALRRHWSGDAGSLLRTIVTKAHPLAGNTPRKMTSAAVVHAARRDEVLCRRIQFSFSAMTAKG